MANTYSPDIKAQVIADYKAGASLNRLVSTHGVPKSTVRDWVDGVERTTSAPKTEECGPNLDEMAWGLVNGSFLALGRIQGTTGDDAWLKRQPAGELAILYGVIADKLIRVLSARREADDADSEQAQLTGSVGAGG